VLRCVSIPESIRDPIGHKRDSTLFKVGRLESRSGKFARSPGRIMNSRQEVVAFVLRDAIHPYIKHALATPHGGLHARVLQPRAGWGANEVNITTEATSRDRPFHLTC